LTVRSFTGLVSITLETGTVTYPGQWDALVKA